MTATEANPPRRSRPWLIVTPLLVVILVAIVWSGAWVYAANRAEHEIDAWVDREARLGRVWNCAERSLGGYPFRFELKCRQPTLETKAGDPLRFTAVSAQAVAQVWAPNHIVAEFHGPARVEDKTTGRAYAAAWSQLQMSGVGDLSGRPQRFSLQVREPRVEEPIDSTQGRPLFSAHLFEFHARRTPAANGGPDDVDYASGLTGGESAALAAFGTPGPVDMTLQGTVTASADLRPMPLAQRLRAWAAAGGVARLARFAVTTPQLAATATGEMSLDRDGRLNGKANLGFSGINDLVQGLDRMRMIPGELAPIVGALAMVGKPTQVEGRSGVAFNLGFANGTLRLGGFPVGMVPPLF